MSQPDGSEPSPIVGPDPVHPEPLPVQDAGPGWSDPGLRPAPAPPLVLHPVSFLYIVGGLLLAAAVIGLIQSATAMLWTIAMGVVLALSWPSGAVYAVAWIAMLALLRISSLSGMAAAVSAPVSAAFFGRVDLVLLFLALALIVLWKHRDNVDRLLSGTEPRVGAKKSE